MIKHILKDGTEVKDIAGHRVNNREVRERLKRRAVRLNEQSRTRKTA